MRPVAYCPGWKISGRKKCWPWEFFLCLGILAYFKYINFIIESLQGIIRPIGGGIDPLKDLILPLGISFFVFQACAYMIDVSRGKVSAEKNIITFALFLSFFPIVLSGPIERASNLLVQLRETHPLEVADVTAGMRQILYGLFKKIVLADMLARSVNPIFNGIPQGHHHGQTLILAAMAYSIQIYCDFSGYSDIAIGSARVLGYRLRDNFNMPYFSGSFTEFWSRWHISLSTWFRDYLYIPLGGNKRGFSRKCINLMIVFVVSGLWHGADWKYVMWGAIHGIFRMGEEIWAKIRMTTSSSGQKKKVGSRFPPILRAIVVFIGTTFAWIFFRANSLSDALSMISRMTHPEPWVHTVDAYYAALSVSLLNSSTMLRMYAVIVSFSLAYLLISELIIYSRQRKGDPYTPLAYRHAISRWANYILLTCLVIWSALVQAGGAGQSGEFIYFKF